MSISKSQRNTERDTYVYSYDAFGLQAMCPLLVKNILAKMHVQFFGFFFFLQKSTKTKDVIFLISIEALALEAESYNYTVC